MVQVGSCVPGQVVNLAETGEMINLMLGFVYPKEPPTIASFEMLNKAMHVARKYELEGMHRRLRRELAMTGSPISYSNDPLGAFAFATAHDLKEEAKLALDMARQTYPFDTVSDLVKISKTAPASVPWILLFGIPCIKKKILSDVLLKFHEEPMRILHCSFVCPNCSDHQFTIRYSPPEWQARWAHALIAELAPLPIDAWAPFFQAAFLSEVIGPHGSAPMHTAKGVCTCVDRCKGPHRAHFLKWSYDGLQCLVKRMEGIRRLEKLIM
ncbi:hypothetical protein B0J17DRAFT_681855 [Rhizoctonia solani]|nr:hypothetical protein B0J17DRAFT_681855 [Rhizoctonia solani]